MDECDGIGLTEPFSSVKTMTAPYKLTQANEKATSPAFFMSASAASADTRLDEQPRRSALRPEEGDRHCRRRQSLSPASECPSRFASARFRDEPSRIM